MPHASLARDVSRSRRGFLREAIRGSAAACLAYGTPIRWGELSAAADDRFRTVAQSLQDSVRTGAFPGCTAAFGNSRQILWQGAFGFLSQHRGRAVKFETLYDLASVTKIVGSTAVAARLIAQQKLSLDDPVDRWIPDFTKKGTDDSAVSQRKSVSVRHLLTHTSGLPAWKPLYKSVASYREMIDAIVATPLEQAPGEKYRYSDLGLMLLGELLARAGGSSLPELERELIFKPLGMASTLRNPSEEIRASIAPTERIGDTDQFWRGVVHDENSRAAEGLTGHAGLFSNIVDLAKFSQAWLRAVSGGDSIFEKDLARRFISDQKVPGDARRALGWQLFARGGSGGSLLDESAFGHTGFTGTSLWLDPTRDLFLILLGNRVHPTRENRRHLAARRNYADAVVRAVEGA